MLTNVLAYRMDYNSYFSNSDRATIQLAHDSRGLTVSEDVISPGIWHQQCLTYRQEARKLESDAKRRLLKEKKLSLVVDLDQTIIHATVDPTVGEWKADPFCVNHESVKDVEAFKLDENVSGGGGTWYYVKMRPGLKEFLQHISKLFELHIYTMGTRAYAMSVKKIVDPDGSLFGERVLSRDESGSMTQKSLHRLFPVDTKMVVIIDDRGDVWKWNDNLVKVRPYDFFVGIGDINSMFLPKKQDFPVAEARAAAFQNAPEEPEGLAIEERAEEEEGLGKDTADPTKAVGSSNLSALEQLITMGSGSDQALITDQTSQLDKAIEAQKEARPLAKKQELQDRIDEEAAAADAAATENGDSHKHVASEGGAHKHSVLQDNDWELTSLQSHLSLVHERFYREYEKNKLRKDRVSQLKDKKTQPPKRTDDDGLDLSAVPDVATIMPTMKKLALSGVVLVFSGVIPLGADVQK
jgi:RNA polymerase II subunit A-like phosphatase